MRSDKHKTIIILIVAALLLAGTLTVLLPQADTIGQGIRAISEAKLIPIAGAIVATAITYFMAAFTLMHIALKPLAFKPTLIVQIASGFASKLVPAGIGGLAVNTRFLTKHRHNLVQASSVMAVNWLLGLSGHLVIVLAAIIYLQDPARTVMRLEVPVYAIALLVAAVIVAFTFIMRMHHAKKRIARAEKQLRVALHVLIRRPGSLLAGYMGTLSVTFLFSIALFLCAYSLGIELSVIQVLFAYTAAVIGAAVVPTPGGIGGAEAALAGSLIAVGVDTTMAVSVAVLYRLITFWLPILPGFFFFEVAIRKKII